MELQKSQISEIVRDLTHHCEVIKMPIFGFLRNIDKNILPYSAYVDTWPNYTTMVVKPNDDQIEVLPVYRLAIYSINPVTLEYILTQKNFIPVTKTIRIYGLLMDLIPVIENVVKQLGMQVKYISKEDPRNIVVVDFPLVKDPQIIQSVKKEILSAAPEHIHISRLDSKHHTEIIANTWKTQNWHDFYETDEEGIKATQYYINTVYSIGLFRKSDNLLLAWFLGDIDGGSLFRMVIPEYRNRGFDTLCVITSGIKCFEEGILHWGYVAKSNVRGQQTKNSNSINRYNIDFVHCVIRPKVINNSKL